MNPEIAYSPPRVSVVMAAYNAERFLAEAVDSILGQEFTDFEFIIVEDGSTDDTLAMLQQVVQRDARVRLLVNDENRGIGYTANRGLATARGVYIARMDADDIALPHRLGAQVEFLEGHPSIGVLAGQCKMIDERGVVGTVPSEYPLRDGAIRWYLCFSNPITNTAVMFRKSDLNAVGGAYVDERGHLAEDYDLWQRLSRVTQFQNLPSTLVYLRRSHSYLDHASRRFAAQQYANCMAIAERFIRYHLETSKRVRLDALALAQVNMEQVVRQGHSPPAGWTVTDAQRAFQVIYQLAQVFLHEYPLADEESRYIRHGAATAGYRYFRPFRYQWPAWQIWRRVWQLDRRVALRPLLRHLK